MKGAAIALALVVLAGCSAQQVQQAVADGQLFCAMTTGSGPLTVAVQTVEGIPILAKNNTAAFVASTCAAINAIPVSPPATPSAAPVVTVNTPAVTAKYHHAK